MDVIQSIYVMLIWQCSMKALLDTCQKAWVEYAIKEAKEVCDQVRDNFFCFYARGVGVRIVVRSKKEVVIDWYDKVVNQMQHRQMIALLITWKEQDLNVGDKRWMSFSCSRPEEEMMMVRSYVWNAASVMVKSIKRKSNLTNLLLL